MGRGRSLSEVSYVTNGLAGMATTSSEFPDGAQVNACTNEKGFWTHSLGAGKAVVLLTGAKECELYSATTSRMFGELKPVPTVPRGLN